MRYGGIRRRRLSLQQLLVISTVVTGIGLFMVTIRPLEPQIRVEFPRKFEHGVSNRSSSGSGSVGSEDPTRNEGNSGARSCATVEEMGEVLRDGFWKESLKVRKIIQNHFILNGASRVRDLPPEQFCRHGFILGKSSEAGFGNEMYKVLTGAALSIMLNRSLIIGQTRRRYPFEDYISYSNDTFTLKEVKHLWRHNGCVRKYGRHLVMRTDDFEKPAETNVLCSNWREWKQPIIWFQGTTNAVAAQFFLKNIHSEMRNAASNLFGDPEVLQSRPNVFGELMRVLISPSKGIEEAVNWVIGGKEDPDISLHMRMLMNRSVRAVQAALKCIRKALKVQHHISRPKLVLVSDTPSLIKSIMPNISEFAEVLHFDYELFKGKTSNDINERQSSEFRVKDWGPAPRWVAFVDFFLASRAKHAVISGAHRRVGTTYAQLIAALAAAQSLGDTSTSSSFEFLSSFQSNLLTDGLKNQIGWGHVWNRFAGPLSCHRQPIQCAFTPILPPAWWDGLWQSPIPRDINRLASYGIELSGFGIADTSSLQAHCRSRKKVVKTIPFPL
ncbi:Rhamnogalacturonate lyase family protein [Quillaja saponaria]|uniref:Rhamnogalacturonate lyase family protein n=1 Tax=Quillaja saponaria TaxID=32244 RepID=A0AAD7PYZ4_QUISA|nr:Rhamnogalacturonate lyase family protein [Quillaja saponaria]